MAVQAIGGISATAYTATAGAAASAGAARGAEPDSRDSTVVISRITKTDPDGSTTTTITYADGHTKVETTPPKFSAAEGDSGTQGEGRVTAVDLLA
jgi:hypothetical protein